MFEVVPVAGLTLEQAEEGQRNAHEITITYVYTLSLYARNSDLRVVTVT
jgi:hypothetical protein